MRVIAGLFKGRLLRTIADTSVRPATDRVKETLFNVLVHRMDFANITVLDLFAGSGSLGIEALSRGAARATFVESNRAVADYLAANVRSLGCQASATILTMDAMQFLSQENGSYDLIFADPPYSFPQTGTIPDRVCNQGLLNPGGYLLVEHSAELEFPPGQGSIIVLRKKFGQTLVTFFQQQPTEGS
jgi:16S rRNA (guanine966-N2)-methyltransferase